MVFVVSWDGINPVIDVKDDIYYRVYSISRSVIPVVYIKTTVDQ